VGLGCLVWQVLSPFRINRLRTCSQPSRISALQGLKPRVCFWSVQGWNVLLGKESSLLWVSGCGEENCVHMEVSTHETSCPCQAPQARGEDGGLGTPFTSRNAGTWGMVWKYWRDGQTSSVTCLNLSFPRTMVASIH
jgi:hypothetical protein